MYLLLPLVGTFKLLSSNSFFATSRDIASSRGNSRNYAALCSPLFIAAIPLSPGECYDAFYNS